MQYRLKLGLGILFTMSGAVNLHAMEETSDAAKEMQIVQDQQDKKRKEPMTNDNDADGDTKKMKSEQDDDQASSLSGGQYAKVAAGAKAKMFQPIGDKLQAPQLDHERAPTASVATVRAESSMPNDRDWWWQREPDRASTVLGHSCKTIQNDGEFFP